MKTECKINDFRVNLYMQICDVFVEYVLKSILIYCTHMRGTDKLLLIVC